MRYTKELFGLDKVRLTPQEQIDLRVELKRIDRKRIKFFALISLIAGFIYFILDFFIFTNEFQFYYLVFDIVLLFISFLVLSNSFVSNKKQSGLVSFYQKAIYLIFPATMLLWSAGVFILKPDSILNIITYYLTLFLLSFTLLIPINVYAVYFATIIAEYIFLISSFNRPLLSETLVLIVIGTLVSLPFYMISKTNRRNSQAALIKLNKSNRSLEGEVTKRVYELKQTNENLEHEIVQRKMVEIKLRDALKEAEENNKLKSEFLANISHEIRTPLNSIIGFTELMTEDSVSEIRKKEYQELVASNTMYLLSTVDDIFDASLVHTDQIKPISRKFHVNQFLDAIKYEALGIETKHVKKHIKLVVQPILNNNLTIDTDEFYLKKAFIRLLDNSYKFTSEGEICIGARVLKGQLCFYVKDDGIGILEKDYSRIFEPFVQGDGSYTRGYGGSGLGLTIVNGIVKALGCEFSFKTKPNKGSTFFIIFDKSFLTYSS